MNAIPFDTLAFSKRLRGQFSAEQADALAEAFVAGVDEQLSTKGDLKELELRLDTRFAQVDKRFAELETKIADTARQTTIWTMATFLSGLAIAVAIIKLVP